MGLALAEGLKEKTRFTGYLKRETSIGRPSPRADLPPARSC